MLPDRPSPRPARANPRLTPDDLAAIDALSELPRDTLASLAELAQLHPVGARKAVMMARQFTQRVGLVRSGAFRLVALTAKADVVSLMVLTQGDMFGACSAILGLAPGANVRLIAEKPGEIVSLPDATMRDLLQAHPQFAAAIMRAQARALADAHTRLFEIAGLDVRGRLIGEILRLGEAAGVMDKAGAASVSCPTHSALAAQIGASREAVTRQLAWLETAGLVRVDRGAIELVDHARLQALYRAAAIDKPFTPLT